MTSPLRIAMLGTGDFAVPTFERLAASRHEVIALVTQPDKPQGRRGEIIPSRIKLAAEARGVPVEQPESINAPEGLELVKRLAPDLLVTAAYGQILSGDVLSVPPLGGINLHGSILPKYRGAAPVARAIQHGEAETGVTVIRMTPRVDAGGMLSFARTAIGPDETAGEVEDRLALIGAPLVLEAIEALVAGTATILPQDASAVTKAPKLKKDDGRIDWSQPAATIHNLVRAMQPWPVASTNWERAPGAAVRLIVHETRIDDAAGEPGLVIEAKGDRLVVAAGSGAVRLVRVQLEGKKAMGAEEFLRGYRAEGTRMRS
ncbi:MAG TPA: methionyl-tRNA formyltransferase [Isosphaeraceae bacterium]|jgi:methionyl-tRNA formyltransferase